MVLSLIIDETELRNRIKKYLKFQGFLINPHLRLKEYNKDALKKIHTLKRREQLRIHKNFLIDNIDKTKTFSISGKDITPKNIELELIEVKSKTFYSTVFFWWNLVWWSIPYAPPIGRQMRFLLWDKEHDAPFGLIGLQSPPLGSAVRDEFLKINNSNKKSYWINQSLYAQRIGALPPYNDLLGGKMVSLALVSNEIRKRYSNKYKNVITTLNRREIPNRLLFITTTSAFGKSSVYERIKYKDERISEFIGYTEGAGSFHLSERLYIDCLKFLKQNGINIKRGWGSGSSRKMKLIARAFRYLGLPNFDFHKIKRGYYFFSNVKNLEDIIHNEQVPIWYNRPFLNLFDFWKERWCIPRDKRTKDWKIFDSKSFFDEQEKMIKHLKPLEINSI